MPDARQILTGTFYSRGTIQVARELLGKQLVSTLEGETIRGIIVETEAYLASGDSACHASKRRTPRTEVMFGRGGLAYVYPIHGRVCFNVVTETEERGCAVLIRAVEPTTGWEVIKQRRGVIDQRRLTTGPACLCQAFAIGRAVNQSDLTVGRDVWVEEPNEPVQFEIGISERIGVTSAKNLQLRFYQAGNPFVSGPSRMRD